MMRTESREGGALDAPPHFLSKEDKPMREITKVLITPVDFDCNMACGYCYNGSFCNHCDKSSRSISMDTIYKIFDKITPYLKGNKLFVIWHGGEPLLANKDFYREAIAVQGRAINGRYIPVNCLQTNATLIDEGWAQLFIDLKIQPSVSIDGPANLHDSVRKFPNGSQTYKETMRGYNLLRNRGINTGMLMVISQNNVRHPEEIWNWILEEQISRFDFLPCIEPKLWREGKQVYGVNTDEILNFSTRLFDLWFDYGDPNIRIRTFRDSIKGQIGGHVNLCSWKAGCLQHLSFDSLGSAYPCARYHCYPETILGNINEQDFMEVIDGTMIERIHQNIKKGQEKCKPCKWYEMCHSGCPFLKYALYGTWEGYYVHCQFRQSFFAYVKKRIYKKILK